MKIDDNFTITGDRHGFILEYKGEPVIKVVKGEEKTVIPNEKWYFASIEQGLKKYVDFKAGEADSIEQLIKTIEYLKSNICLNEN